jgi:hypothetical protein
VFASNCAATRPSPCGCWRSLRHSSAGRRQPTAPGSPWLVAQEASLPDRAALWLKLWPRHRNAARIGARPCPWWASMSARSRPHVIGLRPL